MKRLTLLLFLFLLLLPVVSAHADPFTPEAESYYASAIGFWGEEPSLCISINKEMQAGSLSNEGRVVADNGKEIVGLATEPTHLTNCVITIKEGMEPWQLCRVVRHEVGHLEGHGHSTDPTDIMYPEITAHDYAPGCPVPPELIFEANALAKLHQRLEDEIARCRAIAEEGRSAKECWWVANVARFNYTNARRTVIRNNSGTTA